LVKFFSKKLIIENNKKGKENINYILK
jgi:hypothetical protein